MCSPLKVETYGHKIHTEACAHAVMPTSMTVHNNYYTIATNNSTVKMMKLVVTMIMLHKTAKLS